MTKADRQKIFEKYGGKCAYCGCELQKGWHVDEIEPVRRNWTHQYDLAKGHHVRKIVGAVHPERFTIENQNPACASCNINKHSESLEDFRAAIKKYVESLNMYITQYKIAKRYGLIQETNIDVKFYFEKISKSDKQ